MSGKRSRRANKLKKGTTLCKGCLCKIKGSDKQGIYQGMGDALAVVRTAYGDISVPVKNIERVSCFDE